MMIENKDLPFTSLERERYLEDYTEGAVYVLGEIEVDGKEMVEFAKRFDPQDMHVNEAKAKAGPFKGLIASGWFTGSVFMRLFATHYLSNTSSMASPGFDDLKWNAPVRPGDILKGQVTINEVKRSKSKPDRGVVKTFCEIINQDEVVVMSIRAVNMIASRSGKDN